MSFFKELKEDIAQSVSELTESLENDLAAEADKKAVQQTSIEDMVPEKSKKDKAPEVLEVDTDALADLTAMYGAELQGDTAESQAGNDAQTEDQAMRDLIASEIEQFAKESEEMIPEAETEEESMPEFEMPEEADASDDMAEISPEDETEIEIETFPETEEAEDMELKEDSVMNEEYISGMDAEEQEEVMMSEEMMDEGMMDDEEIMEEEITVITQGTTINGSIKSDTSLLVKGTIEGDVECQGKLTIEGRVAGNTIAKEIYVNTPRLEGDINSRGIVKVDVGTVVIGNVSCTSLVIAGAVKGDIDVNGPVVVDTTAVVKGNVRAKSIQLNSGAIIDGNYSLAYADVDVDTFFE